MIPFLVCEFDKSTLSNLVKECFGSFFPEIFHKRQINYLYRYLSDLGAKTVLLEREYVDKDYLEDFSRYYVKCFSNAGHKCARLHFFSKKVSHGELEALLASPDAQAGRTELNQKYLGFIVIKPLPQTFIGKTCLKQYSRDDKSRKSKHCLARIYDVDLFGIKLQVESIAFQEQDKVVSACATTSIWSALHALKSQSIREIPACSEITTNAINHIDGSSNSFPNKELSNKQIMRALDVERLRYHAEPFLQSGTQSDFLQTVCCHIDSEIPLILGVDVYGIETNGTLKKVAGHAITILGYKSDIDDQTIYIHDDRLGPYARATFRQKEQLAPNDSTPNLASWGLVLQEKDDHGSWVEPTEFLVPCSLIIPAHRKIRLPALLAKNTCETIKSEYTRFLHDQGAQIGISYKLKLDEISKIRQSLIAEGNFPEGKIPEIIKRERIDFLTGSYARYQWVASFFLDDEPAFKILFDATDIPQGNVVSYILTDDETRAQAILELFRNMGKTVDGAIGSSTGEFFVSFLKYLTPQRTGFSEYLERMYGQLRAPKYLKPTELLNGRLKDNGSVKEFYEFSEESLEVTYPDRADGGSEPVRIWAIAEDGTLLIGEEFQNMGHPTITGFKPARIAGELKRTGAGWCINAKSGRYSGDYHNRDELLANVLKKFQSIFPMSRDSIAIEVQLETTAA